MNTSKENYDGLGRWCIVLAAAVLSGFLWTGLGTATLWAQFSIAETTTVTAIQSDLMSRDAGSASAALRHVRRSLSSSDLVGNVRDILRDNLMADEPLDAATLEKAQECTRTAIRQGKRLGTEQRAYLYLLQALIVHNDGEGERAIKLADRALRVDPQNIELSDALMVLGYYWQDYDCLRRALRARNGGAAARLGQPSSQPTEMDTEPSGPDPNSFAGPTRAGQPRSQRLRTARARAPRRGGVAMARSRGGRVGMVRGRPAGRSARTPRGQIQTASRRTTTSVVALPVEYMPFEHLGRPFGAMQLRTMNDCVFRFEPQQQRQLLWVLLWTLTDGEAKGSARIRPAGPVIMQNAPAAGMPPEMMKDMPPDMREAMERMGNMPPMPGGPPAPPNRWSPTTSRRTSTKADADLAEVFEQFRSMFAEGWQAGTSSFLSVNLDPPNRRGNVITESVAQIWPWQTCMAYEPTNSSQWAMPERFSPIVMLIGSEATIRYMGPPDGFLPEVLARRELGKLPTAGGELAAVTVEFPPAPFVGRPATVNARPVKPPVAPALKEKHSEHQAANMLRAAHINKRLLPRKACSICDDIIERWPDSLEADEAKILIEDLLRRNSRWRKERESQGKYVGK